jgi:hypothetical protein
MSYVVAIPSYNRSHNITDKVLTALQDGNVSPKKVYIFVANKAQGELYKEVIPENMYHKIVVGVLGITNQRNFISDYFPEGQYVVSLDDDITSLQTIRGGKYVHIHDLDKFFKEAHKILKQQKLYIWGVYPVKSLMFMYNTISFDLKFLPGFTFGYINRHLKELEMSSKIKCKEDVEQSILYYLLDGGVVRFNNVTPNQSQPRTGGLGKESRHKINEEAANYLIKKYPDLVTIFHRKNGLTELRLARRPRIDAA